MPSLTLAIYTKEYKFHRALNWLTLCKLRRLVLLIAIPVNRSYSFKFYVFNWNEKIETGGGGERIHEEDLRVAGDTADIETGQLLITKRCLCPIFFCDYKCLNIGLFYSSAVIYTFIHSETTKMLQADGVLSLHATLSFSVGDVIKDNVASSKFHCSLL